MHVANGGPFGSWPAYHAASTTNIVLKFTSSTSIWTFSIPRNSKSSSNSSTRATKGYIPHVVVLDARRKALYNQSGEVESQHIEDIFKNSLGH